ncbi:MAG: hypothetical protein KAU28_01650, partial [Phycisphaerae bacterium]|nr:hypothetical protein [Phycisphaerae bacterium]
MGASAAGRKSDLFVAAAEALSIAGVEPSATVRAFFVPGRVEVLGKHTDYAGGRSLLAAAERGFCLVAAPRNDGTGRLFDVCVNEGADFTIAADLIPAIGHWSNYPMTV